MKRIYLFSFFILAIVFISNGQTRLLLEGTIGNKPIVLLITGLENEVVEATFFFKEKRRDHAFEGRIEKTTRQKIYLKSEAFDHESGKDYIRESIEIERLRIGDSFVWKGIHKDLEGHSQSIKLKAIDLHKYSLQSELSFENASIEEKIYSNIRLKGIKFYVDSITVQGKYQIQWEQDSTTEIGRIQIKNGFDPDLLKKINHTIRQHFYDNLNQAYACTTKNSEPGNNYDLSISEVFISETFISIQSDISWYCGGEHPGTGDNSLTIDVKTGKKINDLDELFWFAQIKPVGENDNAWLDYIDKKGEAIKKILTELYPNEMKEQTSHDSCNYSLSSNWEFPSWYFTKKGFYIGATFPHGGAACDKPEFSYVPNSVLKKYLNMEKNWVLPPYKN